MNQLPPIRQATHPLGFVLSKHQNALRAVMGGTVTHSDDVGDIEMSRTLAIQTIERHGWTWPPILDEEFPPATPGGLKYERVTIEFVIFHMMV